MSLNVHLYVYMYVLCEFCSLFGLQSFNNINLNLYHMFIHNPALVFMQDLSIAGCDMFSN